MDTTRFQPHLFVPATLLATVTAVVVYFVAIWTPPLTVEDVRDLVNFGHENITVVQQGPNEVKLTFTNGNPVAMDFPTSGRIRGTIIEACYGNVDCNLLNNWAPDGSFSVKGVLIFRALSDKRTEQLYNGYPYRLNSSGIGK